MRSKPSPFRTTTCEGTEQGSCIEMYITHTAQLCTGPLTKVCCKGMTILLGHLCSLDPSSWEVRSMELTGRETTLPSLVSCKDLFGKSSRLVYLEWALEVQIFQAIMEHLAKLCLLRCTNLVCFIHSFGLIARSTILCVNHGFRPLSCRLSSENPSSYAIR